MAAGDKIGVVMEPQRGVPHGVATLNSYGTLPYEQMPYVSGPPHYTLATNVEGAGWHRVCTGMNFMGLMVFGNVYNHYGPSEIVLLVNMNYYAPRVNILMAGFYGNNVLFDKVRLSADQKYGNISLEVHYTVSTNMMYAYGIPFFDIGSTAAFAMNTFEKPADTPAVVVMPEMAITPIPSGSLVTSGQLTAAIERGLSL